VKSKNQFVLYALSKKGFGLIMNVNVKRGTLKIKLMHIHIAGV